MNPEDAFREECRLAAPFFAPDLATKIRRAVPGNYGLGFVLSSQIPLGTWGKEFPTSIHHFATTTKDIFSTNFHNDFLNRVAAFDEFCAAGTTGRGISFSDYFIRQQTIVRWTYEIVDTIVLHCRTVQQSGRPQGDSDMEETTLPLVPNSSSPAEDGSQPTSAIPTIAELSPTPAPSRCHISQIILHGNDPFRAWAENEETRDMEAAASRPLLQGEEWDPSHCATRQVYQGTGIDICTNMTQTEQPLLDISDGHRFKGLKGQCNPNQVAPCIPSLRATWTGYSPQRCFLWAVFRSEVIWSLERNMTAREATQKKWKCQDHEHTGVLLLKFRPPQQANAYTIPNGREHDWHMICSSGQWRERAFLSSDEAWSYFSGIHGGSRTSWPEVIHTREHGPQLAMSRQTHQHWRTVYHGEAIATLNQSHEATYAISMLPRPKTPETSLPSGGTDP
ncbi:hypothetical protein EDB81DRAFT_934280 [Dactylonectria macrodidyma]|uniref:Uncharacterized protein n=1 Tax=Dactylonectria macrodidyma TaxID=307937 RepID=A0A9P9J6G6_9HYPO|nr:hypothetical protein EDB81DRAFT_934280 [Dactylonectria macrodidyma]